MLLRDVSSECVRSLSTRTSSRTRRRKRLVYFVVDFDNQKDAVKSFGARMQSTLIAFKGEHETGRSVGDTDRASIAALLNKTL
jgi:hypothetical protein